MSIKFINEPEKELLTFADVPENAFFIMEGELFQRFAGWGNRIADINGVPFSGTNALNDEKKVNRIFNITKIEF